MSMTIDNLMSQHLNTNKIYFFWIDQFFSRTLCAKCNSQLYRHLFEKKLRQDMQTSGLH